MRATCCRLDAARTRTRALSRLTVESEQRPVTMERRGRANRIPLGGLISDHQMSDFTWRLPFLIYFPSIEIFLLGLGNVMTLIDAVGYLASALVLLTFCMSTMLRLRAVAICSNLAFVGYGLGEEVYPVLILHLILLPLNVWLLVQMTLLLRKAKLAAATDLSPAWLQPFMRAKRFKAGEIIFRKGDFADSLYMIASGPVRLLEID
jgi:hypothetical protein